ncbi:MAG: DNA primase [Satyrvirus sp.]|uniref:DNA primase n=1 Tax=Satyrvirus sp. TaxID=2487771 RepID=A0A3G5AHH8_9VIRU|nr:MAG: DNA primase [Satyrvirus sp.]
MTKKNLLTPDNSEEKKKENETNKIELNEMEKIYEFMAKYRVKAEEKTKMTHTMAYQPYISSKIPKNKEEKFMKLYEDAIMKGHNVSIMEISKGFGPLVIKIKLVQDQEEKLYTEELLKQIIELCNGIIKKYVNVKSNKMGAYVLEHDKPIVRRKEYYYNIRIIYPNICVKNSLQTMITKELLEIAKTNKIFGKKKFKNNIEEIINIDNRMFATAWTMYGSKINIHIPPPKITHIYEIANDKVYDSLININPFAQETMDQECKRYYIRLLSIRRYTEDDIVELVSNVKTTEKKDEIIEEELKKLLDKLYEIGGLTDNNLAKIFHYMYPNLFIYDPLATFGSNKKEGTWLTYDEYGKYHICDGMQKAKILLSTKIHDILKEDFDERLNKLKIETENDKKVTEKEQEKILNKFNNKGNTLLSRVKNTVNKCQIIEQLKEFYGKEKIFEKLDEVDPYLIGFDNGVYDLKKRIFRKAEPEELMYITTGYSYKKANPKYVEELEELIEDIYPDEKERKYQMTVNSFCLPGVMHLQEFYMMIGTGGNGKGIMIILIQLVMGSVYCTSISVECFKDNGKVSSNERSQQLAVCKNARLVFVTECNFKENEEFESGLVKSISGGDEQNCKLLYKEQTRYIPKFNLFFITNDQIPIKIKDRSIPRRSRICPHRISFKEDFEYDPTDETQCLAITGLDNKLREDPEYKYAFFQILLNYYFDFIDNNKKLEIPQSLIEENINFKNLNDPIGNFIRDCINITKDNNDKIKTSYIMTILKEYNKETNESFKSIKNYFEKKKIHTIKMHGYPTYIGIKFKKYNDLIDILNPTGINMLIDLKLIDGEKITVTDNDIIDNNIMDD